MAVECYNWNRLEKMAQNCVQWKQSIWEHNRLMSNFGLFLFFAQICQIFGMRATN